MADDKTWYDKANDALGAPGFSATWGGVTGGMQAWQNLNATNPLTGLPTNQFGFNDVLRPLGLNYDAPAAAAGLGNSSSEFSAAENAWFAGEGGAAASSTNYLGAAGAALGLVGGGFSLASGVNTMMKGGDQNTFHGLGDVAGGVSGIAAGGLGIAASGILGAGAAGATAAASAVAAPVAAAIGLAVAGDHHGEEMGIFGHDAEGHNRGAFQAAWETGMSAGDWVSNATGSRLLGAGAAGLSTVGLEAGAAVANIGLGIDGLGASSGMFGTATNADGQTYNMGAYQALDRAGQAAGSGVTDFLGLEEGGIADTIAETGIRGLVDVAGFGAATVANVAGGIVGGVGALGGAIADW
jgi:hypothetical protein